VKGRCPRPTRRWGHCFYQTTLNKKSGGARRVRTADLNTASVALSQLSYGPLERARTLIKRGITVKLKYAIQLDLKTSGQIPVRLLKLS
jgi:hypothetical protein